MDVEFVRHLVGIMNWLRSSQRAGMVSIHSWNRIVNCCIARTKVTKPQMSMTYKRNGTFFDN